MEKKRRFEAENNPSPFHSPLSVHISNAMRFGDIKNLNGWRELLKMNMTDTVATPPPLPSPPPAHFGQLLFFWRKNDFFSRSPGNCKYRYISYVFHHFEGKNQTDSQIFAAKISFNLEYR